MSSSQASRFIRAYAVTMVCGLAPLIMSASLLFQSFEWSSLSRIVRLQQERRAIFGSAIAENMFAYKRALVAERRPDVIALGSSRTLQYREEFFSAPFVNAGGAMTSLAQGLRFLRSLERFPRVIIMPIDLWWFDRAWRGAYDERDLPDTGRLSSLDGVLLPARWVWSRRLSAGDVWRLLTATSRADDATTFPKLGVKAATLGDGFRRDGSFEHGTRCFRGIWPDETSDAGFARTLAQVDRRAVYFADSAAPDATRLEDLRQLLELASDRRAQIVVLIAPLAPPVADRIASSPVHAEYVRQSLAALRQVTSQFRNVELHDLSDGAAVGRRSCEYLDGIHEGDVTTQRELIAAIAAGSPSSALRDVVRLDAIEQNVAEFSNRTVSVFDRQAYRRTEVDFLELGCHK